jgi:hypothetical protein
MQKYKIHIISGKIFSENRDLFSEKAFVRKNQATLEHTPMPIQTLIYRFYNSFSS